MPTEITLAAVLDFFSSMSPSRLREQARSLAPEQLDDTMTDFRAQTEVVLEELHRKRREASHAD